MKRLLTCFCLAATCAPAFAQKPTPQPSAPAIVKEIPAIPQVDNSVRQQVDAFFAALEDHKIDDAYNNLTKDTKIAQRSTDVATLKSKTQQAIEMFGDILGHDLVEVKSVRTHLVRVTYLSLGKDYPLRWRFYFYKSAATWRLIDIRVDDRLADIFGETTTPVPAESPSNDASQNP